jgi:hypothetical protein
MVRTNRISSWVGNFRRRQGVQRVPRQIIPSIPRQNLRILILLTDEDDISSKNFCRFIIDNIFVNDNIDVYKPTSSEESNLPGLMQKFWDQGYRLFIATHGSTSFASIFDWLNSKNDVIYINTLSTVSSESFLTSIPTNSIRTSMNDLNIIRYLLYEIIPKFKQLLINTNNHEVYAPLLNIDSNEVKFKYIVYIYEPSLYTTSYKNTMQFLIDNFDNSSEVVFVPIELDYGSNTLPDIAKYYLTFNNVSSTGYATSNEKPLIILNSSTPQSLLNRLKEIHYYDNYFITGDVFLTGDYTSKFIFNYAFSVNASFSEIGYKLSYYVDTTRSTGSKVSIIYDILSGLLPIFKSNISTNKIFVASSFLEKLKSLNYVSNNNWYDACLTMNHITYENYADVIPEEGPYEITYDLAIIKKIMAGSNLLSSIINNNYTLNYDNMSFTKLTKYVENIDKTNINTSNMPTLSYQENINKIKSFRPGASPVLNDEYDVYYTQKDFNDHIFFFKENFTRDLPEKMFAKYYCFENTSKYNIPIIYKILPTIKGYVSQDVYNLHSTMNSIERNLTLTIPEFSYIKNISTYNLLTSKYESKIDELYVVKPSFEITITDSIKELYIYFYLGNQVKLVNKYDSSTELIETLNSYVKVLVTIDWRVIKRKYIIGDVVTKISDNRKATIIGVSSSYYDLKIQYNDSLETEDVTQDDIAHSGILADHLNQHNFNDINDEYDDEYDG